MAEWDLEKLPLFHQLSTRLPLNHVMSKLVSHVFAWVSSFWEYGVCMCRGGCGEGLESKETLDLRL